MGNNPWDALGCLPFDTTTACIATTAAPYCGRWREYAGADCHVRTSIAYQRELLSPTKQDEPFRGDLASIVASNSAISSYDYLNDPSQNRRFDPASPSRMSDHRNR